MYGEGRLRDSIFQDEVRREALRRSGMFCPLVMVEKSCRGLDLWLVVLVSMPHSA
jgi:hypothetical protein